MAEAQQQTTPAKKSDTVKVKVIRGRILRNPTKDAAGGRGGTLDDYASVGDVIEMSRTEAEKLAGRSFDGYPSPDGTPGVMPGTVNDSPIEILAS
jgi:hypothetical protein